MKYLIVVAHPDDEVLGAGASIYKWTRNGDTVDVCIMSSEAKARTFRPDDKSFSDDTHAALRSLGVIQTPRTPRTPREISTPRGAWDRAA